jgi:two-component system, chemotaxis family, chemotaxis protein CheY
MKCLIAEDHLLSRKILKELLSSFFECDVAVNGQEAINSFALAHEAKLPYGVIFLDIMMPEVNGLEALKSIRSMERTMEIPHDLRVKVIITTVLGDMATVMKSFNECGADSFMLKPLSKQRLHNELHNLKLV